MRRPTHEVKIGKLYVLQGNKTTEVTELHAGDLGALQKIDVATGDTLSTKGTPIQYATLQRKLQPSGDTLEFKMIVRGIRNHNICVAVRCR